MTRETKFRLPPELHDISIQSVYHALAHADTRNDLIFNDLVQALDEGYSPLLLTERRDHLEHFAERLQGFAKNIIVLRSGMGRRQLQAVKERLSSIANNEERVILATGRYIGEGFDDPRLDTLFLALPIAWRGTLQQYVGRLHRNHPGKKVVRVFDYVDVEVPVLARMYQKRIKGYKALDYTIGTSRIRESGEPQSQPLFDLR